MSPIDLEETDGKPRLEIEIPQRSSLAVAGTAAGDRKKAIDILKLLAMTRPNDARIYEALGVAYQGLNRDDAARLCFDVVRTLRREP